MSVHFGLSQNQQPDQTTKDIIIKIVKEQKPKTTSQLIRFVQEKTILSEKDIIAALDQLEAEDKIQFRTNHELAITSMRDFLFAPKSAWYLTTIAVALVALVTVFTIPTDLYPLVYVRNVLGVIFVLFLPGYAFTKVFFPTKVPIETSSESFDNIERVALSVGLSIALTSLVGLMLYFTPLGIGLTSTTLSLLALTIIFATAAVAREYQTKSTLIQKTH